MPNIFLRQDFSPSCPSGGNWYACGTGSSFVGCCNSEPCDNGCPDGNLEPASFNPAWFGKFPDQECPTGSLWYTCQDTNPPFMGCCKSSPCGTGCLAGNLTAGFLSSNPALAAKFSPSPALSAASTTIALSSSDSDTSSSTTIPPISQTASARPTSLSMSTVTSTPVNGASSDSTGQHLPHHSNSRFIIAGCVIGGTLVFFILLLLYCYRRKRINKRKKAPGQPSSGYNGGIGTEVSPHDLKQSSIHGRHSFHCSSLSRTKCDLLQNHRPRPLSLLTNLILPQRLDTLPDTLLSMRKPIQQLPRRKTDTPTSSLPLPYHLRFRPTRMEFLP